MKFCPNCGSILEEKLKCNCGYDTLTEEIDEKTYKNFINNEKSLYEQSYDNMSLMGITNQYDVVTGAKMMGMNPNTSTEEILNQIHQPIFNKDNDNIFGKELTELIKNSHSNDSTKINESKISED